MDKLCNLKDLLQERFADNLQLITINECVTIDVKAEDIVDVCTVLRDEKAFQFDQLIDLCGVDYLDYGMTDWSTEETTHTGFSRGVRTDHKKRVIAWDKPRFGVVYNLLSVTLNHRLRIHVYLPEPEPSVASVLPIWQSVDWYEREAFDMFGILFIGHPDLRRILTDYGFSGYPMRKNFSLVGDVEMRYDAKLERCIYEPVSIQNRINIPKVIRDDARYINPEDKEPS